MEFKASGTLLGFAPVREGMHLILVDRGAEYVVSTYYSGFSEWNSGRYFSEHKDALNAFARRLLLESNELQEQPC